MGHETKRNTAEGRAAKFVTYSNQLPVGKLGFVLHIAVKCKTCQQVQKSDSGDLIYVEDALKACGYELVDNLWECSECVTKRS